MTIYTLTLKYRGLPSVPKGVSASVFLVNGYEQTNASVPLGNTEISTGSTVNFATTISVDYHFDMYQLLIVDLINVATGELLGRVETLLANIIGARGQSASFSFFTGAQQTSCALIVSARKHTAQTGGSVKFKFAAKKLDKKDLFGKSDPYFKILRIEGNSYADVYQSEYITQDLNPKWKSFEVPLDRLVTSKRTDDYFLVQCFDWDRIGSHDFIGECRLSLDMLRTRDSFPLINSKKARKSNYKDSGKLIVSKFKMDDDVLFNEYLSSGLNLNVLVAIDFSDDDQNKVHWLQQNPQYLNAIKNVVSVLEPYDTDRNIPVYRFGGTVNGDVSPIFPLNGNHSNPEVSGLNGVLSVYLESLKNTALYGKKMLSPIIEKAGDIGKFVQANQLTKPGYLVCVIFTTGDISDVDNVSKLIKILAEWPISFIIINVGNQSPKQLEKLEKKTKITLHGQTVSRDTVKVISMKSLDPNSLSKKVLKRVPGEVVKYLQGCQVPTKPLTEQETLVLEEERITIAVQGGSSIVGYPHIQRI